MIIIAGLGNPGLKYRRTRHNAGFDALDVIAKRYGIAVKKKDRQSLWGQGTIDGHKVTLVKPQTFMNRSGESVAAWVDYYGCDPARELIVLSDDVALAPGSLRIRGRGSAGGHNGLKNIIKLLGTEQFIRLRIGVGEVSPGDDMILHVLGRMRREERRAMEDAMERAADAVRLVAAGELDEAMNRYNRKAKP